MKRLGFIYEKIYEVDNIREALHFASKGKKNKRVVKKILDNEGYYVEKIHIMLKKKTFVPFEPKGEMMGDGINQKQREIFKPKFYPDQIIHWAIILQLRPIIMRGMYKWSCASIPGRGTHYAKDRVEKWLRNDIKGTKWCLQLDIEKYYPNIDKEKLKDKFRNIIKCKDTLNILNDIVDSHDKGLPIGNYTSQWFANFYLQGIDHFIKEVLKVKYYARYMDDLVLLHPNKKELRKMFLRLKEELNKLGLEVKGNYQIFNIDKRPLNFVGFIMNHKHTYIRKKITKRARRKALRFDKNSTLKGAYSLTSYYGWYMNSDSYILKRIYFSDIIKKIKEIIKNESRKTL
jgi:RNA-directed DNA polymerase